MREIDQGHKTVNYITLVEDTGWSRRIARPWSWNKNMLGEYVEEEPRRTEPSPPCQLHPLSLGYHRGFRGYPISLGLYFTAYFTMKTSHR